MPFVRCGATLFKQSLVPSTHRVTFISRTRSFVIAFHFRHCLYDAQRFHAWVLLALSLFWKTLN
jgi:hypothetical protein